MGNKSEVSLADLSLPDHAEPVISLLDAYARDLMGGGQPLTEYTRANLIRELDKRENCFVFLARVDGVPAGLAICFESFSTFSCRSILNIHDFVVAPEYRGRGLSGELLAAIEAAAVDRGCCKLTLEVLEGNRIAQHVYQKFGFAAYELDPKMGRALFFEKPLLMSDDDATQASSEKTD